MPGPPGRQENSVWQTHLFLLSGPDIEILPSTTELERFANMGLGKYILDKDFRCNTVLFEL